MGAGFGVGGHGEAVDLDVVAGDGGLAGEDGWALRGRALEPNYGEVGGVDPHFAAEEMRAFAERPEGDDDALAAVEFDGAGLGVELVVFGGDECAFAVGGEVDVFFARENSVDDRAAEEGRTALRNGGVFLTNCAGVDGLDGLFGGGGGVAVAVEGVLLLDGVAGDGVETAVDGGVDAMDDFGVGLGGGRGLLGEDGCDDKREDAARRGEEQGAARHEA